MKGRIFIVNRYKRSDLKARPDALFVFGDNLAGFGRAGQARECRGEPNAVGIPTKWHPTRDEGAYFTDAALKNVKPILQSHFRRLAKHISEGGDVVWPAGGIGTGLADLPRRAPAVHAYLTQCFDYLRAIAAGSREGHDSEAWRGAKQARAVDMGIPISESPNPCAPSPNSSQDRV